MASEIATLEGKIRDRINARRKQHELLDRKADWNRLCSALDVIGDTEYGLDAYLAHPPIEDVGLKYLHVYGALQLLQTQQDAGQQICEALQVNPQASPKIPLIREVRSSAIGHPMRRKENHRLQSNFIVRWTLSQFGFTLLTVPDEGRLHVERHISIRKLIELQRTGLAAALSEVITILDEAEMMHRTLHKAE